MRVALEEFIINFDRIYSTADKAVFVDFCSISDYKKFALFAKQKRMKIYRPIEEQIKEYKEIHSMLMGNDEKDYIEFLQQSLNCNLAQYDLGFFGEHVYFSWGECAIFNILPLDMYYQLITWRNKEKIHLQEQEILSRKTVGVVGASVGSFVCKILAKSGIQYLKIAEPKFIKPSNAPRLYTDSVRYYGVHKLRPLVENLYEFNPYLGIDIFEEGINQGNIENFLNGVDVVVDAADDPRTKTLIHHHCEKNKLPLVYGFDERGSLIIQRYDKPELNSYSPPRFTEMELIELNSLSRQDYILRLLDFIPELRGVDKLSPRQKLTVDGMVNGTRGGFSQLAWEASLFGSYVTKAVLDILLGENIAGFVFLDLDQLVLKNLKACD